MKKFWQLLRKLNHSSCNVSDFTVADIEIQKRKKIYKSIK